ncbi:hypothetical protein [Roseateles saccharophilus]|uniref:hypothetical protein n=1 Tax=Roseateles saccharophilus TaxID=304 RepID=UPI00104379AE|nr:hypothetical protein [Roseateles saccharophilus]MDG0836231.1 hypothetical protein [Roseateles saccharophilus]
MRNLDISEASKVSGGYMFNGYNITNVMEGQSAFSASIDGQLFSASWDNSTGSVTMSMGGATITASIIGDGIVDANGMCYFSNVGTTNMMPSPTWDPGSFSKDAESLKYQVSM